MRIIQLEDFDNIWRVEGFDKEFQQLFGKSQKQFMDYQEILFRDLELLNQHEIKELPQFEVLVGEDHLYSIRLMGKANCRILYTCILDNGKVILLFPFLEKSKNDYEKAKKRARPLVKELLGGNYHE